MWLFDAFASGFQSPTDPGRLQMFRILFGITLALRFGLSFGHGGWTRFVPGSISTHLVEQRLGPTRAAILTTSYRPVLILRTAAALALAAGLLPRLAVLLVLAGLAMELLYLKSPNAVRLSLLTGACLLVAGNLGTGLHIDTVPSTANTWSLCLLVLICTDIYWNSAWQKTRSPQFRSGLYLAQWIHTYTQVRDRLAYPREFAVPGLVRRYMGNLTSRDILLWRVVSITVIAVELALPPTLLFPLTMPYAVAAGIGMHAAFQVLKPRQLITFSGVTTGTYFAFAG